MLQFWTQACFTPKSCSITSPTVWELSKSGDCTSPSVLLSAGFSPSFLTFLFSLLWSVPPTPEAVTSFRTPLWPSSLASAALPANSPHTRVSSAFPKIAPHGDQTHGQWIIESRYIDQLIKCVSAELAHVTAAQARLREVLNCPRPLRSEMAQPSIEPNYVRLQSLFFSFIALGPETMVHLQAGPYLMFFLQSLLVVTEPCLAFNT